MAVGVRRLRPERSALGHFPTFLATNHFCGEGYWFWVIPLHGRTLVWNIMSQLETLA